MNFPHMEIEGERESSRIIRPLPLYESSKVGTESQKHGWHKKDIQHRKLQPRTPKKIKKKKRNKIKNNCNFPLASFFCVLVFLGGSLHFAFFQS